jgi:hypothetical protein
VAHARCFQITNRGSGFGMAVIESGDCRRHFMSFL